MVVGGIEEIRHTVIYLENIRRDSLLILGRPPEQLLFYTAWTEADEPFHRGSAPCGNDSLHLPLHSCLASRSPTSQ